MDWQEGVYKVYRSLSCSNTGIDIRPLRERELVSVEIGTSGVESSAETFQTRCSQRLQWKVVSMIEHVLYWLRAQRFSGHVAIVQPFCDSK